MQASPSPGDAPATPPLFLVLALLWLAGAAMRIPLLAVPPVIPLIHDDLHMTETQVGLLMGMPLEHVRSGRDPGLAADCPLRRAGSRDVRACDRGARRRGPGRGVRCLDALCRDPADGLRRCDLSACVSDPGPALGAEARLARQCGFHQWHAAGRDIRLDAEHSRCAASARVKLAARSARVVGAGDHCNGALHRRRATPPRGEGHGHHRRRANGGRTGTARNSGCWASRSAPTTRCSSRPTASFRTICPAPAAAT